MRKNYKKRLQPVTRATFYLVTNERIRSVTEMECRGKARSDREVSKTPTVLLISPRATLQE